jgi:hypothetical protein
MCRPQSGAAVVYVQYNEDSVSQAEAVLAGVP